MTQYQHTTSDRKNYSTVTLVRHGTTHLNESGKIRGWHDIPLAPKGIEEAFLLAESLRNCGIEMIITSDLIRAQQTAEAISDVTGAPIILATDILRPWHVGEATGRDVLETLPVLRDHAMNKPDISLPGGESFRSFQERFLRGFQNLYTQYAHTHFAIITHHRGDRVMAAWEAMHFSNTLEINFDIFLQKGIDPATARQILVPEYVSSNTPMFCED